ncbi:MAG: hypothetical protein ACR2JE_05795, partial [Acidobacteriaceae bacterium]
MPLTARERSSIGQAVQSPADDADIRRMDEPLDSTIALRGWGSITVRQNVPFQQNRFNGDMCGDPTWMSACVQ